MDSTILDKITEGTSTCYLTKIALKDFVESLPGNYKDYEVQREIVSNTYLDNLIDTVLQKKHIPPIVLVAEQGKFIVHEKTLTITEFKILDGLQRTFRLKLIWDTLQLFQTEVAISNDILSMRRLQLSRKYSEQLDKINSNSRILESIIKYYNDSFNGVNPPNVTDCFASYQWFEIWTNLTPQEEVNKMLVLNAGHKPVKTQHQLELLFLHLIPIIKKSNLNTFDLIREKNSNSTVFSKNRSAGQFHFSHLITSILSLNEGKPITANVNLVHKAQAVDFDIEEYDKYFNYDFLHRFVEILLNLDQSLSKKFPANSLGIKWMGREVSLVGMFAALGKYGKENSLDPVSLLNEFQNKVVEKAERLNLDDFEKVRNNLDLSKVNIGTVNKNAVYNATYVILSENNQIINWTNYFKGQSA